MLNVQVCCLVDWSVVTDVSKYVAIIFSFEQSYSFFYNCHKSDRLPIGALDSLKLKMKVLWCFKTSVTIWESTWCNILRRPVSWRSKEPFKRYKDTTQITKEETFRVIIFATRCWGADKSLARPTSRCILFDGENTSFDATLLYI